MPQSMVDKTLEHANTNMLEVLQSAFRATHGRRVFLVVTPFARGDDDVSIKVEDKLGSRTEPTPEEAAWVRGALRGWRALHHTMLQVQAQGLARGGVKAR